jgi:hypothetical protein
MFSCLDTSDTIKFNFVLGSLIWLNGSDQPVLWASSGTSDFAPQQGNNQVVEVGIRRPDPVACYQVSYVSINNSGTARYQTLQSTLL